MADQMTFPDSFMDFIREYAFNDKEKIYTNGSDLISVFRVEQAWDHYNSQIKNAIENIKECYEIIYNNISDINNMR